MKKILLPFLTGAAVLMFSACNLGNTQTREECLSGYFSAAKSMNYTSMYQYIHPDNPNRDNYKSGDPWDTIYKDTVGSAISYSITSTSGSTYQVFVNASSQNETFTFREDGTDYWQILSFTHNGVTR